MSPDVGFGGSQVAKEIVFGLGKILSSIDSRAACKNLVVLRISLARGWEAICILEQGIPDHIIGPIEGWWPGGIHIIAKGPVGLRLTPIVHKIGADGTVNDVVVENHIALILDLCRYANLGGINNRVMGSEDIAYLRKTTFTKSYSSTLANHNVIDQPDVLGWYLLHPGLLGGREGNGFGWAKWVAAGHICAAAIKEIALYDDIAHTMQE